MNKSKMMFYLLLITLSAIIKINDAYSQTTIMPMPSLKLILRELTGWNLNLGLKTKYYAIDEYINDGYLCPDHYDLTKKIQKNEALSDSEQIRMKIYRENGDPKYAYYASIYLNNKSELDQSSTVNMEELKEFKLLKEIHDAKNINLDYLETNSPTVVSNNRYTIDQNIKKYLLQSQSPKVSTSRDI
jgi:hypothetical protein